MTTRSDSTMESHPENEFAIFTQGLTRHYGQIQALVDLDLGVPYGSIFGYLGRNGAGKTTTIRLLTGLSQPTGGRAWVGGYETGVGNHRARRLFGYLPQEPGLYAWMKGREFLEYCAQLLSCSSKESRLQAGRVLELTGLEEAAQRRIGGYSGGMKQRLAIAQALIGSPRILILDEPTSSLDPAGRQELLDTLSSLRGEVTVFFSSHILGDIERICDTIAVLHDGRLVLVSSREQLLEKYPVNAASLVLGEGSLPPPAAFLEELQKCPWVDGVSLDGQTLSILARDVPRGKTELLPLVVRYGVQVEKYDWVRPSLEQIFLEISR